MSRTVETVAPDRAERTRRSVRRWCATAETTHELLEGVANRVRPILEYEGAAWLVTDPASVLLLDGYVEGFPADICGPWIHNQIAVPDVMKFTELARRRDPSASLHAETDGDVATSALWRDVYEPASFDDELRSVFRDTNGAWGIVGMARAKGQEPFSADHRALLTAIGPDLAAGLRRITRRWSGEVAAPNGPGLLLIRPSGEVTPGTEAGAQWLDRLVPADSYRQRTSLLALQALVAGGHPDRHVRLRTRDGVWVTLHAEAMTDDSGTLAVIVEAAHPRHIAEVVARAHGLSTREQEVALAIARGATTDEIAGDLFISTHTVRDHLKSAFAKTGVGSRAELVDAIFHDHYADDFHGRVEVVD